MSYDPRENIEEYYPSIRPQTPAPEVDPGVLETHLLARNNPHVVTAEQTGAYDKSTVDNKIETATNLNKQALNEAVGKASGFAGEAKSAAGNAQASAKSAETVKQSVDEAEIRITNIGKDVNDNATKASNAYINTVKASESVINEIVGQKNTAIEIYKITKENLEGIASNASRFAEDAKESVKTASESATDAATSATQASKSAQQAEDAKNAIGDVGGRLDAVETSVGTLTETVEVFGIDGRIGFENLYKHIPIKGVFNMYYSAVAFPCKDGFIVESTFANSDIGICHIAYDGSITVILSGDEARKLVARNINMCTGWDSPSGINILYINGKKLFIPRDSNGEYSKTDAVLTTVELKSSSALTIIYHNGFLICSNGNIYDTDFNLKSSFSLVDGALYVPQDELGGGIIATSENTICRVTVDSNGAPILEALGDAVDGKTSTYSTLVASPLESKCYWGTGDNITKIIAKMRWVSKSSSMTTGTLNPIAILNRTLPNGLVFANGCDIGRIEVCAVNRSCNITFNRFYTFDVGTYRPVVVNDTKGNFLFYSKNRGGGRLASTSGKPYAMDVHLFSLKEV